MIKSHKLCLRPGREPDTPASSEAGETWRWLADVERPSETNLGRHTAAFMWRAAREGETALLARGSCCLCGQIFYPVPMREDQEATIKEHLEITHGFVIVRDPRREPVEYMKGLWGVVVDDSAPRKI